MRLPLPPRIPVASREDREARLKVFITDALAALKETAGGPLVEQFTLVARAPDSPAAHAVEAMANEIAAANITIRVILFETEPLSEDSISKSLLDISAVDARTLTDLRFASAHEQLVLGRDRVWIGDCMRRDPAKRDAFEMYHYDHDAIAGHAMASFAKLWEKSVALKRIVRTTVAADVILAGQATPDTSDAASRC